MQEVSLIINGVPAPRGAAQVSCSDDATLKFWRCAGRPRDPGWKCVRTLSGHHARCIYSVHWAPCAAEVVATGGLRHLELRVPDVPDVRGGWCGPPGCTRRPAVHGVLARVRACPGVCCWALAGAALCALRLRARLAPPAGAAHVLWVPGG